MYTVLCSMEASYVQLVWSVFGVIPINEIEEMSYHQFTRWIGDSLLGAYMVTAMTVMINILIAMMSRSFKNIEVLYVSLMTVVRSIKFLILFKVRFPFP